MRKNFIPLNEGFTCDNCNQHVPPAKGTFRNHCPFCLTGKHVDHAIPGDRASHCLGLMPTISWEGKDPDTIDFIQQCQNCNKTHRNRRAADDDWKQLLSS